MHFGTPGIPSARSCRTEVEMFANRGNGTLFWFAVFLYLLAYTPMIRPQDPYGADTDGMMCSAAADETRFAAMREDILVKLSSFLSLNASSEWLSHDSVQNASRHVNPALLAAYAAAARVLEEEEEDADCGRGRGTPFAKRVAVFFPTNSSAVSMPPEIVNDEKDSKLYVVCNHVYVYAIGGGECPIFIAIAFDVSNLQGYIHVHVPVHCLYSVHGFTYNVYVSISKF